MNQTHDVKLTEQEIERLIELLESISDDGFMNSDDLSLSSYLNGMLAGIKND